MTENTSSTIEPISQDISKNFKLKLNEYKEFTKENKRNDPLAKEKLEEIKDYFVKNYKSLTKEDKDDFVVSTDANLLFNIPQYDVGNVKKEYENALESKEDKNQKYNRFGKWQGTIAGQNVLEQKQTELMGTPEERLSYEANQDSIRKYNEENKNVGIANSAYEKNVADKQLELQTIEDEIAKLTAEGAATSTTTSERKAEIRNKIAEARVLKNAVKKELDAFTPPSAADRPVEIEAKGSLGQLKKQIAEAKKSGNVVQQFLLEKELDRIFGDKGIYKEDILPLSEQSREAVMETKINKYVPLEAGRRESKSKEYESYSAALNNLIAESDKMSKIYQDKIAPAYKTADGYLNESALNTLLQKAERMPETLTPEESKAVLSYKNFITYTQKSEDLNSKVEEILDYESSINPTIENRKTVGSAIGTAADIGIDLGTNVTAAMGNFGQGKINSSVNANDLYKQQLQTKWETDQKYKNDKVYLDLAGNADTLASERNKGFMGALDTIGNYDRLISATKGKKDSDTVSKNEFDSAATSLKKILDANSAVMQSELDTAKSSMSSGFKAAADKVLSFFGTRTTFTVGEMKQILAEFFPYIKEIAKIQKTKDTMFEQRARFIKDSADRMGFNDAGFLPIMDEILGNSQGMNLLLTLPTGNDYVNRMVGTSSGSSTPSGQGTSKGRRR